MMWPLVGALHLGYGVFEAQNGNTAQFFEFAGVRQLSHQENASTIGLF